MKTNNGCSPESVQQREKVARAIHARRYHMDAKDTDSMFAWYAENPQGTDRSRLAIYSAYQDSDAAIAALSSDGGVEVRHAETGNMPGSVPGEEVSSAATSFERPTVQGVALEPCAGVTPGPSEPITHRWRSFGAHTWIYDPEPEWLEDHKFEVEWEPVYGAPQLLGVAQKPGWQPIETAPKDGTRIDVWFQLTVDHGGRWANVSWSPEHKIWSGGPPSQYKDGWVATYWMPFPACPSVTSTLRGAGKPLCQNCGDPVADALHASGFCGTCREMGCTVPSKDRGEG